MNEILKKLDTELKLLVEKYINILPEFNLGDDNINLISRMKYAEENKDFKNELDIIKSNFELNNKNIEFLFKMYKEKYIYGFNFPANLETYNEML